MLEVCRELQYAVSVIVCRPGLTGGCAGSFPVTGAITSMDFTQANQSLLLCTLVDDKKT